MHSLAFARPVFSALHHAQPRAGLLIGLILLIATGWRPVLACSPLDLSSSNSANHPQPDGHARSKAGSLPPATRVLDVRAEPLGNGLRLTVQADGVISFKPFILPNPWRLVIDITGVRNGIGNTMIPVASAVVSRIRVGQPETGVVRIVLDTPALMAYKVEREGDRLVISVGRFNATPSASNLATTPAASPANQSRVQARQAEPAPPTPQAYRAAAEPSRRADETADDRVIISRLLRRVDELEARIHELEDKQPHANVPAAAIAQPSTQPATETVAAATKPTSRQESSDNHAEHSAHDDSPGGRPRLQLQGFADVDYRATNQKGKTNAFTLGQLDLFLSSRLSDKFSVLSELIIEAGSDNAFSFEIHRLLLQYYPNDYFNLNIGRYHTAIGYFNTAFHHGQWFQTAVTRPFIFAFEGKGGILPLHNVGMSVSGRIPSGALGLRYIAEIGNGRAANSAFDRSVQSANDENNGKAVNFGLLMRPDWASGLQAGFSVYHDRLTPNGRPTVDQTIMAAHAIFRNSDYEWLNEALLLRHAPAGGSRVFNTPAFYTQVARRFRATWPYFRYEYFNMPDDDPLYGTIGRRNGPSIGLRYDLTEFAAFKVQYDHVQRRRQKSLDELLLQMAFTF